MEFIYNEKDKLTHLTIYKEKDVCARCPIEVRENCPLLLGMMYHVVYPSAQSMEIENCALYESLPEEYKNVKESS